MNSWIKRINLTTTGLIILGAILIRLSGLLTSSIWYDEAFSLQLARFDPLRLVQLASTDFNPPLWEMVIWPFVRLFGFNELGIRLPAIIAAAAGIYLAYRLTVELEFTRHEQLTALAIIAVLPGQIWAAQDGRVYALFGALYLAAAWFAIRQRPLGLIACCGLLCYAHNAGPFFALSALIVYAVSGAGWLKANWLGWIVGACAMPWVSSYLSSSHAEFWLGPLTLMGMIQSTAQAWFATMPGALVYVIAGIWILAWLFVAVVFAVTTPGQPANRRMMLIAVAPLTMLLVYSLTRQNVIFYRPLTPLVIPTVLFMAKMLTPNKLSRFTFITSYTWIFMVALALVVWTPSIRGGELRQTAETIRAAWQPGDVIYYAAPTAALPFGQYLPDLPGYVLNEHMPPALLQDDLAAAFGLNRAALEDLNYRRAWILWPRDPALPQIAGDRMTRYTKNADMIGVVSYLQAANIEIFLLNGEK